MAKKIIITESQLKNVINELITDTVLLRTMTSLSKFTSGKYKGQTVEEIIRLRKSTYLRWVYYNVEGISFTEDVLRRIGVISDNHDDRIPKPGKNPELGAETNKTYFGNLRKSIIGRSTIKSRNIGKYVHNNIVDKRKFSRSNLQRRNQGHR